MLTKLTNVDKGVFGTQLNMQGRSFCEKNLTAENRLMFDGLLNTLAVDLGFWTKAVKK